MNVIPKELRERRQWVIWRTAERDGKTTKIPYRADGAGRASSTDAATWSTYEAAAAAREALGANGVGYVFAADDPYVGVDLDQLDGDAGAIIATLNSYTEKSVSGRGAHVIVRADLNGHPRNRTGPLEIYGHGRYFVVTGDHLAGTPTTIEERQTELHKVLEQYLPAPTPPMVERAATQPINIDDHDLIARASIAKNGRDFIALWEGRWQDRYPSQSEADAALCSQLAFWTGRDHDRIDQMFRASGLMRDKWLRDDYRNRTIELAIAGTRDVYEPRPAKPTPVQAQAPAEQVRPVPVPKWGTAAEGPRHLTDTGNALRLIDRHGEDLLYSYPQSQWFVYDGTRWLADDTGEPERRFKEVVRAQYADLAEIEDDSLRKTMLKHIIASESAARVRAALELARSEVPILPHQLDADDWLFNCANGVIDLKTGELRPHRREDLISKIAPVNYDHNAQAPRWFEFLDQIFAGNQELVAYVQRAVGYSLTGMTSEQILFFLWGLGSNGKSTFVEAVRALFGDYGQQAPIDMFMSGNRGSARPELARLPGARFLAAVETGEGRRLDETLVKTLTGGDTIATRTLYRDVFEFQPAFKAWIATNHLPDIKGVDEAIWRRIRLIPFTVAFAPNQRDADLASKLKSELGGILNWAIEGCLAWQRDGLGLPAAVNAATAEYRTDSDVIGRFIEDCCDVNNKASVRAGELFNAYQSWTKDNGETEIKQQKFGRSLSERGFKPHRATGGVRYWLGLTVKRSDG